MSPFHAICSQPNRSANPVIHTPYAIRTVDNRIGPERGTPALQMITKSPVTTPIQAMKFHHLSRIPVQHSTWPRSRADRITDIAAATLHTFMENCRQLQGLKQIHSGKDVTEDMQPRVADRYERPRHSRSSALRPAVRGGRYSRDWRCYAE